MEITVQTSILEELTREESWLEYAAYQERLGCLTEAEQLKLKQYIAQRGYQSVTGEPGQPEFRFHLPEKRLINKFDSGKKRVVYLFPEDENMVLKAMSYHLRRYDHYFAGNCYAFRPNQGAGKAIKRLLAMEAVKYGYSAKLDISNYFNSIEIDLLLPKLKQALEGDGLLYQFLEQLLTTNHCLVQGEPVCEKCGVMAGSPIAGFLANVYLSELDWYFWERNIPYARYSDDIILFADTRQHCLQYQRIVEEVIGMNQLHINPQKRVNTRPGEAWEYLGIRYHEGETDLSRAALDKMKGKIRRKARALYRWRCKKQVETRVAIQTMNRIFYVKFFDNPVRSEMTWSRWFFPLLTTDRGLKELDHYFQQYLRYLATGKHGKSNYKVTYQQLKEWGYRSLVHEYHNYRNSPDTYFEVRKAGMEPDF